jgi:hypothetical protein
MQTVVASAAKLSMLGPRQTQPSQPCASLHAFQRSRSLCAASMDGGDTAVRLCVSPPWKGGSRSPARSTVLPPVRRRLRPGCRWRRPSP